MPLPPMMSSMPRFSSLPPRTKVIKKRKIDEDPTLQIESIDLDDFKFDKDNLKDVMVLNTLVSYFDEGIFGHLELKWDLYHYFKSDVKQTRVRKANKLEEGPVGN